MRKFCVIYNEEMKEDQKITLSEDFIKAMKQLICAGSNCEMRSWFKGAEISSDEPIVYSPAPNRKDQRMEVNTMEVRVEYYLKNVDFTSVEDIRKIRKVVLRAGKDTTAAATRAKDHLKKFDEELRWFLTI